MCGSELLALPEGVQRVASLLQDRGHANMPVMLGAAARTAQQAADGLGVTLGQIAKSIVFKRKSDDAAVLVVTSGDQRVDEKKVEALICADGKRLGRADADFVKARTGFSIGGVSPLAHATPVLILIDVSLFRFESIWAAAGHPNAVFEMSPQELELLTGAPVADMAVAPSPPIASLSVKAQAQAHAIALVSQRAATVNAVDAVPSPCISVCFMNAKTGWCEGCFRTGKEIGGWSDAGEADKREVWTLIVQRMASIHFPSLP
jgi:prolyl-tRNA editing enzyme YbaK/EbsC (Cys-tRNA(Pro) deacylase)/predicted Fe-S protein YdhL (DUF1289 family)